jgi:hypothetical protein
LTDNGGAFDPGAFQSTAFDTKTQLAQVQAEIRQTRVSAREATVSAKERLGKIRGDAHVAAKAGGDQPYQPNEDLYPYLETQAQLTVAISETMEQLLAMADASLTVQRAASEASTSADRRIFRLTLVLVALTFVLAVPIVGDLWRAVQPSTPVPALSPSATPMSSPIVTPGAS